MSINQAVALGVREEHDSDKAGEGKPSVTTLTVGNPNKYAAPRVGLERENTAKFWHDGGVRRNTHAALEKVCGQKSLEVPSLAKPGDDVMIWLICVHQDLYAGSIHFHAPPRSLCVPGA